MQRVESDLLYVRSVVEDAESCGAPASIYFLWGAISLIGYTLTDFRPPLAAGFWAIAGPAGGVLSFVLGWMWSRRRGMRSLRLARYHVLHWSAIMAGIFMMVPLRMTGELSELGFGRAIVLVVALGWFLAGIYLVRAYLWLGLLFAACYLALTFVPNMSWTVVGIVFAVSLFSAGILELRRGSQAA